LPTRNLMRCKDGYVAGFEGWFGTWRALRRIRFLSTLRFVRNDKSLCHSEEALFADEESGALQ